MWSDSYDTALLERLAEDHRALQAALSPYACRDGESVRRHEETFHPAQPQFIKDTQRILNCRYFNRYADKTQVFSLYQNDDITRRMQHVQIVSRIARTAGRLLKLNQDLIEAIALGHDLGHTPFGHLGERMLSRVLEDSIGVPFRHNLQGVRILDRVLALNLSVQTLDGILCHNGRSIDGTYCPDKPNSCDRQTSIEAFDAKLELAERDTAHTLVPSTLEGCIVRFADAISYVRKDREDAVLLGLDLSRSFVSEGTFGDTGDEFILSMISRIVSGSYGKPCLILDHSTAEALEREKRSNHDVIYSMQNDPKLMGTLEAMFRRIYDKCVFDMKTQDENSPIWKHHVRKTVGGIPLDENRIRAYLDDGPQRIAADYIASMTDDYFMGLHEFLFPGIGTLKYQRYFHIN